MSLSDDATPGEWRADPPFFVEAPHPKGVGMYATSPVCALTGYFGTGDAQECNANLIAAAVNFIRQHGQHFAGLEEKYAELRADAEELGRMCHHWIDRAEAAEARCAELERLYAAISRDCNDCANQRNAANARAREAEGLLRHWQAWICGPSELHKATATFLAASGETK